MKTFGELLKLLQAFGRVQRRVLRKKFVRKLLRCFAGVVLHQVRQLLQQPWIVLRGFDRLKHHPHPLNLRLPNGGRDDDIPDDSRWRLLRDR